MNISEIRNKLDSGSVSSRELFDDSINLAKKSQKEYNRQNSKKKKDLLQINYFLSNIIFVQYL